MTNTATATATTTTTTTREAKTRAGNKLARLLFLQIMEASAEKVHAFRVNGGTLDDLEALAVEYLRDYEGNPGHIVDESEALIVLDYYEDGLFNVITTGGEFAQIYGYNLRTLIK